jgi:hypothetical protein
LRSALANPGGFKENRAMMKSGFYVGWRSCGQAGVTRFIGTVLLSLAAGGLEAVAQQPSAAQASPGERAERFRRMSRENEERGLAEPFKGMTTARTCSGSITSNTLTRMSTEFGSEKAPNLL